jgi:hypothetical protein
MKHKLYRHILALCAVATLVAGCATPDLSDQRAASVDPVFSPAPANFINTPQLKETGAGY